MSIIYRSPTQAPDQPTAPTSRPDELTNGTTPAAVTVDSQTKPTVAGAVSGKSDTSPPQWCKDAAKEIGDGDGGYAMADEQAAAIIARHAMVELDQLRAQLAAMTAKLEASKDCHKNVTELLIDMTRERDGLAALVANWRTYLEELAHDLRQDGYKFLPTYIKETILKLTPDAALNKETKP